MTWFWRKQGFTSMDEIRANEMTLRLVEKLKKY